jgi:sugar phosphate isomerase/epimerase
MPALKDLEIGAMFWAGPDPVQTLKQVKSIGVRCGQVGVAGDVKLDSVYTAAWKAALAAEDFTLVTAFAAYVGESYADGPTVHRTVGFIPPATRDERERRTYELCDFAAALGTPGIACHVGFVPEHTADPDYVAVRGMVQRICDYAAKYGQTFALETGQEPANILLGFFKNVGRPNLRINFDPANLIMYGTGDPIEALDVLGPYVVSVHAKDGNWPDKNMPGALGVEYPLGQGSVGMERFIAKLKAIGYKGTLNIEREVEDPGVKWRDMKDAVGLLRKLVG